MSYDKTTVGGVFVGIMTLVASHIHTIAALLGGTLSVCLIVWGYQRNKREKRLTEAQIAELKYRHEHDRRQYPLPTWNGKERRECTR